MLGLKRCPHCNGPVELIETQYGFAIICADHNCLGGMEVRCGLMDDREIFKAKLIYNWNKRDHENIAVEAALECLAEYRQSVYNSCQEPYDEHGQCCVDVLDEAINRLSCFTCQEAVDAWNGHTEDRTPMYEDQYEGDEDG